MKIAIIGSGNIGSRLARGWARPRRSEGRHEVFLGSREPLSEKVQAIVAAAPDRITALSIHEAAARAEAVAIAVHPPVLRDVVEQIGDVSDKILIDTMNTMFRKPDGHETTSAALAAWTGSSRVVKAFNNTGAENLGNPIYGSESIDTFVCGNDAEAKQIVMELARDLGLGAFDAGGLENAALLENFAALWVNLAVKQGLGRDIGFKLLQR